MKKLFLLILGLGIIAGLFFISTKKMPDETKTEGEPPSAAEAPAGKEESMEMIDQELSATELQDFDQEVQALDKSINQL